MQISDHHRHELGFAAALMSIGYKVHYFPISGGAQIPIDNLSRQRIKIKTDIGLFDIPLIFPNSNSIDNFDIIIATNGKPWSIGYSISKQQRIPIILRVWGYKALKIPEYFKFKKYSTITIFIPSLANMLFQTLSSDYVVTLDSNTGKILSKYLPKVKTQTIYPTYASIISFSNDNLDTMDVLESIGRNYVLSIISLKYKLPQEMYLFRILSSIAKKLPESEIVVIGTSKQDINGHNSPKNMVLLGRIYNDKILEEIYKRAILVIAPIFYKTVSNRLLEAIFYSKPILTNSTAVRLHPELKQCPGILISDNYENYWKIVKELISNPGYAKHITYSLKLICRSLFSVRQNAQKIRKVLEEL